MKTRSFIIVAVLASLLMTSCKNAIKQITEQAKHEIKENHEYRDSEKWGKVVEKEIGDSTQMFQKIQIDGNVEVVFTQGDVCKIKAYGNEKAIDEYQFSTENNVDNTITQVINLKNFSYEKNKENHNVDKNTPAITVYITAPRLEDITVYGAGDIKFDSDLAQEENLSITINGAGDVDVENVEIGAFECTINGAGDITAESIKCSGNADFTINGAGDIDTKLKCENAKLQVNGAGDIGLNVKCNELIANCNGVGDIKLKGECNQLIKSDGAIGGIDSRNLKVNGNVKIEK